MSSLFRAFRRRTKSSPEESKAHRHETKGLIIGHPVPEEGSFWSQDAASVATPIPALLRSETGTICSTPEVENMVPPEKTAQAMTPSHTSQYMPGLRTENADPGSGIDVVAPEIGTHRVDGESGSQIPDPQDRTEAIDPGRCTETLVPRVMPVATSPKRRPEIVTRKSRAEAKVPRIMTSPVVPFPDNDANLRPDDSPSAESRFSWRPGDDNLEAQGRGLTEETGRASTKAVVRRDSVETVIRRASTETAVRRSGSTDTQIHWHSDQHGSGATARVSTETQRHWPVDEGLSGLQDRSSHETPTPSREVDDVIWYTPTFPKENPSAEGLPEDRPVPTPVEEATPHISRPHFSPRTKSKLSIVTTMEPSRLSYEFTSSTPTQKMQILSSKVKRMFSPPSKRNSPKDAQMSPAQDWGPLSLKPGRHSSQEVESSLFGTPQRAKTPNPSALRLQNLDGSSLMELGISDYVSSANESSITSFPQNPESPRSIKSPNGNSGVYSSHEASFPTFVTPTIRRPSGSPSQETKESNSFTPTRRDFQPRDRSFTSPQIISPQPLQSIVQDRLAFESASSREQPYATPSTESRISSSHSSRDKPSKIVLGTSSRRERKGTPARLRSSSERSSSTAIPDRYSHLRPIHSASEQKEELMGIPKDVPVRLPRRRGHYERPGWFDYKEDFKLERRHGHVSPNLKEIDLTSLEYDWEELNFHLEGIFQEFAGEICRFQDPWAKLAQVGENPDTLTTKTFSSGPIEQATAIVIKKGSWHGEVSIWHKGLSRKIDITGPAEGNKNPNGIMMYLLGPEWRYKVRGDAEVKVMKAKRYEEYDHYDDDIYYNDVNDIYYNVNDGSSRGTSASSDETHEAVEEEKVHGKGKSKEKRTERRQEKKPVATDFPPKLRYPTAD